MFTAELIWDNFVIVDKLAILAGCIHIDLNISQINKSAS
jgi:hypothetical protein